MAEIVANNDVLITHPSTPRGYQMHYGQEFDYQKRETPNFFYQEVQNSHNVLCKCNGILKDEDHQVLKLVLHFPHGTMLTPHPFGWIDETDLARDIDSLMETRNVLGKEVSCTMDYMNWKVGIHNAEEMLTQVESMAEARHHQCFGRMST
jgi:hypothetical protein